MFGDHGKEVEALGKVGLVTVGVFEEFFNEIVCDLLVVGEEDLLKSENIRELFLCDLTGRVHLPNQIKIAFWPVDKGRLMGFLDPILFPPLPGCIKALQGKAVRVDALVTGVASLAFLVFFDLLPEGGGVFAVLRFDYLNFLGGRGKACCRRYSWKSKRRAGWAMYRNRRPLP